MRITQLLIFFLFASPLATLAQEKTVPVGKFMLIDQSLACPLEKKIYLMNFNKADSLAFVADKKTVVSVEFDKNNNLISSENFKSFVCSNEAVRSITSVVGRVQGKDLFLDINGTQLSADKKGTENFSMTMVFELQEITPKYQLLMLKERMYNF